MNANDQHENEEQGEEKEEEKKEENFFLFDMKGSKKPEYWTFIKFVAPNDTKKTWKTRNLNRRNIVKLVEWISTEMKKQFSKAMDYFLTPIDTWSSRKMHGLLALKLHYLTEDFQMRAFTLEASPVNGDHTAEMIRGSRMFSFSRCNLSENKLSLMLRDSASNGFKACNEWGINHAPCINHLLHLLVGPFLINKRTKNDDYGNNDADANIEEDLDGDDGDDVFEDVEMWNDEETQCCRIFSNGH